MALLASAVGCNGYGATQDPAAEVAGPHASGILSVPDSFQLQYVGYTAADETAAYAILGHYDNGALTRSLWKVPKDGSSATMIWAPSDSPGEDLGQPRVAVGSDAVYWVRGASATPGNDPKGCEVWRWGKDGKSLPAVKWTAATAGLCRPAGLVVSGTDLALMTVEQQCGGEIGESLDLCAYQFPIGTLSTWSSSASSNPAASKVTDRLVAGYLDSAVVADDADVFWFEANGLEINGPNWKGGWLNRRSKTNASDTVHHVMQVDALSYPVAMALVGTDVYAAFMPPSQNGGSPAIGCMLAKAPKAGTTVTTIASDKTRLCVGLHSDGTSGYYASQWFEKPNDLLREAVGRIASGASADAGSLPAALLLHRDDLRIRTVLTSGTDLLLVTQSHIVKLPKSMVP